MFKKKVIAFIIFITTLSIISFIITYNTVVDKSIKKPISPSNSDKIEEINKVAILKAKKYEETEICINKIFNNTEKINITNGTQGFKVVEIDGKNKDLVVANFKALEKVIGIEEEFKKEVLDDDLYNYQMSLKSNNVMIRLYYDTGYMMANKVEDEKSVREIYKLDRNQLKDFVKTLEEIYLSELLKEILYPLPKEIFINAEDENAVYVVHKKEIKNLASKMKILSIEESEKNILIPTIYPSYNITIKRDNGEYKFYLKNNELMVIDTPIVYLYCKYDEKLWNFITDKLSQENNAKENELKFLLNSKKVIVNDIDGVYDLENHTYYNIELPRQILKSDLKEMGDSNQVIIDEDLKFVLGFYVYEQSKQVLVYDNYIVYQDNLYYSKNIAQNIRSLLMIP